jgi:hypothetical protein
MGDGRSLRSAARAMCEKSVFVGIPAIPPISSACAKRLIPGGSRDVHDAR